MTPTVCSKGQIIQLKSSDGDVVPVDLNALLKESKLFKEVIEISDKKDDNRRVPVQINSFNLRLLIKWIEYYKDFEETCPEDTKLEEEHSVFISKHDFEFMRPLDNKALFSLAEAAQYMEIRSLVKVCQKRIANELKYNASTEIARIMNLENDFTEQEENIVRRENEWYESMDEQKY